MPADLDRRGPIRSGVGRSPPVRPLEQRRGGSGGSTRHDATVSPTGGGGPPPRKGPANTVTGLRWQFMRPRVPLGNAGDLGRCSLYVWRRAGSAVALAWLLRVSCWQGGLSVPTVAAMPFRAWLGVANPVDEIEVCESAAVRERQVPPHRRASLSLLEASACRCRGRTGRRTCRRRFRRPRHQSRASGVRVSIPEADVRTRSVSGHGVRRRRGVRDRLDLQTGVVSRRLPGREADCGLRGIWLTDNCSASRGPATWPPGSG